MKEPGESAENNIKAFAFGAGSHLKRTELYLPAELASYYRKVWELGQSNGRMLTKWPKNDYDIDIDFSELLLTTLSVFEDLPDIEKTGLEAVYAAGKLRGYLEAREPERFELFETYYKIGEENPEASLDNG